MILPLFVKRAVSRVTNGKSSTANGVGIQASLETLRIPAYRFLLLDNMFNGIGFQARLMAQAWLVLELTDSEYSSG